MAAHKKQERKRRVKRGMRDKVAGTSSRPRLSVFRSNRYIYAQLIDDREGVTLAAASSAESDVVGDTPMEVSKAVGTNLARRALEKGIERVVFDRNGYRYHGRVQALADGAREGGLQL